MKLVVVRILSISLLSLSTVKRCSWQIVSTPVEHAVRWKAPPKQLFVNLMFAKVNKKWWINYRIFMSTLDVYRVLTIFHFIFKYSLKLLGRRNDHMATFALYALSKIYITSKDFFNELIVSKRWTLLKFLSQYQVS